MADAADAGRRRTASASMVGFTYRRVPAIALARQLVEQGRHRRDPARAGAVPPGLARRPAVADDLAAREGQGRLGGAGRHRCAHRRPHPAHHRRAASSPSTGCSRPSSTSARSPTARPATLLGGDAANGAGLGTGQVTVDDAATFLARFTGGAVGVFEATRFATGRKNAIRLEINGSRGSLAFDFEDMNVLEFYDADEPAETAGFRRILVTEPEHPYVGQLVAARPRPGLRARLHPPGRRPGHARSAAATSRSRPSATACRCSASWPPWSAAPSWAPGSPPPSPPPPPDLSETEPPRRGDPVR